MSISSVSAQWMSNDPKAAMEELHMTSATVIAVPGCSCVNESYACLTTC